MECGSLEAVPKPAMERAFSPYIFCCFIPRALLQAGIDLAYGARTFDRAAST
jgi:hypothetical protein